jgi:hypothetical protein
MNQNQNHIFDACHFNQLLERGISPSDAEAEVLHIREIRDSLFSKSPTTKICQLIEDLATSFHANVHTLEFLEFMTHKGNEAIFQLKAIDILRSDVPLRATEHLMHICDKIIIALDAIDIESQEDRTRRKAAILTNQKNQQYLSKHWL